MPLLFPAFSSAFFWAALLASAFSLPAGAQVVLSYGVGTATANNVTAEGSEETQRRFLQLGYDLLVGPELTLRPRLGLFGNDFRSLTTLTDPQGYSFGLSGHYGLQSFAAGNTYALGELTYFEFGDEVDDAGNVSQDPELQFALGVGADLSLGEGVSAFTNLNYVFAGQGVNSLELQDTGAGLTIGIEISF